MQKEKIFETAVAAIDAGDITALEQLIDANTWLLSERRDTPDAGYFQHPCLLWFIANNPIRRESMAANIVDLTAMLIRRMKETGVTNMKDQLGYTLALVVSGRIPKEQGVQIPLAELLISEGAKPGGTISALAHNNLEAAKLMVEKGDPVELITAVCLDLPYAEQMAKQASEEERLLALIGASFYGKVDAIRMLINQGTGVNGYVNRGKGFHSHATALHQAVFSGSLESVSLLVEAGADLYAEDKIYHGTPAGWAEYSLTNEDNDPDQKGKMQSILEFLQSKMQ